MRRYLPIILIVIAAAAAYMLWQGPGSHAHDGLVLQGNVDIREVDLGFRVGGRIAEMRFEEGDPVKKGDILAKLDQTPYINARDSARAQMSQAEADLAKFKKGNRPQEIQEAQAAVNERASAYANARQLAERQKPLVESGAISRQDYDNAAAIAQQSAARLKNAQEALRLQKAGFRREDIAAASAALEAAKARLATAETNLADTDIAAPDDGIIFTRVHEPGAIVPSGAVVYTLALSNPVWVRAYVDEPNLSRIKPGMEAEVTTDSDPSHPFKGKIGFISPQAEFTPKTVETRELRTDLVYRLRVLVDDPEGKLRQGMPTTVAIPAERK